MCYHIAVHDVTQFANQSTVNMDTECTEKDKLLQSVMQGRLEFFRSCSIYSPLPGAAFQKNRDGSFYCSSGIDFACCNAIIGDKDTIPSDKEIENAIEFFGSHQLPFHWWSSAKNLEAKGFQFGGILTGIALDISNDLPNTKTTSKVQIKITHEKEGLNVFTNLFGNAFGMKPNAFAQFQAVSTAAMNKGEQVHFLAFVDGKPVGTATLATCPASAGIWSLSTLPEFRKNGVGSALVSAALAEAKKRKYDQVMAILMPKGMAWGLFTKLGFKEVCKFPFYVYGVSAKEFEK